MIINLYYNASDNEEVDKNITILDSLEVHPVEGFDIENPVVRIGSRVYNKNANYAYIPEYQRYYYVGKPTLDNNKMFFLPLNVDVLMTFKEAIRALPAIIDKEEADNVLYIDDGEYSHGVKNYTRVYNFTNGFNDNPDNILICAGGE